MLLGVLVCFLFACVEGGVISKDGFGRVKRWEVFPTGRVTYTKEMYNVRDCRADICRWDCKSEMGGFHIPIGEKDFTLHDRGQCYICDCLGPQYNGIFNQKYSSCMEQRCASISATCKKKVKPPGTCCTKCLDDTGGHGEGGTKFPPFTFPPTDAPTDATIPPTGTPFIFPPFPPQFGGGPGGLGGPDGPGFPGPGGPGGPGGPFPNGGFLPPQMDEVENDDLVEE